MPGFIISVRELYDRDFHRSWEGVDAGFGVLSQPIASQNAPLSAIAFADVAPEQEQVVEGDANESEAVRPELFEDNTHHVRRMIWVETGSDRSLALVNSGDSESEWRYRFEG